MKKQVIDLSGPEGNAFYLMGLVNRLYRQAGAPDLAEHVLSEMKSGDYENLLQVFEMYLGDRFELVR
jgi:hypothetical protein